MQNTKHKCGLSHVALLLRTSRWQPPIAVSEVSEIQVGDLLGDSLSNKALLLHARRKQNLYYLLLLIPLPFGREQ